MWAVSCFSSRESEPHTPTGRCCLQPQHPGHPLFTLTDFVGPQIEASEADGLCD